MVTSQSTESRLGFGNLFFLLPEQSSAPAKRQQMGPGRDPERSKEGRNSLGLTLCPALLALNRCSGEEEKKRGEGENFPWHVELSGDS